jgi:hypothetical protein
MATPEGPGDICDNGYKCLFKDENIPDHFKCSSCGRVSRELHRTDCCGARFCAQHLKKVSENKEGCPQCGEEFESLPCKKKHEKITKFNVLCTAREQGCAWEGVVEDFDEHKRVCEHVCISCPKGCGQEQIRRGSLEDHISHHCPERKYTCPHCNYKDTYKFVTNAHLTECSYKPVACPNQCGVKGERDDMDTHLQNECPLEYIACKFGCSTKLRREDEAQHLRENSKPHFAWLANTTLKMSETIEDLTAENKHQEEQNEKMRKQLQDITTAQQQQENSQDVKREFQELLTQLEEGNKKAMEELTTQLEQVGSRLELLEKQVSNMSNNVPQNDVSPPEQSGEGEWRVIRDLERKSEEKEKELRKKLQEHEIKSDKRIAQQDSKIAKLESLLLMATPGIPKEQHPPDDHHEFTLKKYSTLKKGEEQWSSPSFPAFENGPQLKLIVWPNGQGEGRGTHISVWLAQDVDELEQYIETYQVTLKLELIGQCPPNISAKEDFIVTIPNKKQYIGDFSNKFIPHSSLTNYLVEDSLDFQVTHIRVCIPEIYVQ